MKGPAKPVDYAAQQIPQIKDELKRQEEAEQEEAQPFSSEEQNVADDKQYKDRSEQHETS